MSLYEYIVSLNSPILLSLFYLWMGVLFIDLIFLVFLLFHVFSDFISDKLDNNEEEPK